MVLEGMIFSLPVINCQVPTAFQINKYTQQNLIRYVSFLQWVQTADPRKLKFCDESHVVPRKLANRKVCGLVNKRVYTRDATLHQANGSISLMTSLDPSNPIFLDFRTDSNTQWDFVAFVLSACALHFLVAGDFLVVDNAAVHAGAASLEILLFILQFFQVS
jgi:hypothetical protein